MIHELTHCRSFTLQSTDDMLLSLGGDSLEELSFVHPGWGEGAILDVPAIARMTGLTRLVLQKTSYDASVDITPLQELGLLELHLIECPDITEALIVPGALIALRKLYLEKRLRDRRFKRSLDSQFLQAKIPGLVRLRDATLSLPSLQEVDGIGSFFTLDPPQLLPDWSIRISDPRAGEALRWHTWKRIS